MASAVSPVGILDGVTVAETMIHFLTGKPGGGKGLVAMTEIIRELTTGSRVILTDLPVRLQPWLRKVKTKSPWIPGSVDKFQPELGLLGYLYEKYGKTFDAEKRLRVLDDKDAKEFYLHRMQVETGQWIKMPHARDDKGRVESFETAIPTYGSLTLMDECWRTFPAREWTKTGPGVIYYTAQHRHLGDEVFFICQHTKQVECALRDLAQDFWVTKNHSKLRIGLFRQPHLFTVNVFEKINALVAMETRMFRIDKRGVGGCYDTAAGTGLTGGNAADLNEKARGVPFPVLVGGIALVMLLLWQSPNLMGMAARKVFANRSKPVQANSVVAEMQADPAAAPKPVERGKAIPVETNSPGSFEVVPDPIYYCGYLFDGKRIRVILSKGPIRVVRNEFRENPDGSVILDGVTYPRKEPEYVPEIPRLPVQTFPNMEVDRGRPETSVTIIGKRNDRTLPNSRENFFGNP